VGGIRKRQMTFFAVKGSRFIMHIKRLNNLGRGGASFMRRIRPLKEKLGPLLWQLVF